ncbi:MAG: HAMP domain-containing histidine kinase, partial [Clostridiales bacterium]|nr:HAMP domain-containing histidine kinase [Clostridiales bacterium]
SHELRTPLTAIRGWGETVKSSIGADDGLVEKGVGVILSEADRLSGLVEELLDFSRMQSGRLSMQVRRTDILAELGEAVYTYEELARRQGLDLSFIAPEHLPPVMGDGDRLKQVFINIIDNAVKYTNTGGQVLVEAAEQEGCIQVTVKDTGVGIPAQDVDRVKEKFFKSNKTVRGSGIGLAVADEIVKQHKGLLFVESKEGVGTTVTIVLPVAPAAVEPAPPAEEPRAAQTTAAQPEARTAPAGTEPKGMERESDKSQERNQEA